jgi:hypothetical protein
MQMDFEREILDLKRRVGDLEGAVNVLSGKINYVQPELASLSIATSARFDGLESLISRLTKQLDDINTQVWSLRDDFPELINHAVRVALRNTLD